MNTSRSANYSVICRAGAAGHLIVYLLAGALLLGAASIARADAASDTPSSPALVDALNGLFGKQTTGRAIHAKGIVLEGSFMPDKAAASLSSAPHFQGGKIPVVVRFSSFAGIPTIPDTAAPASPRGLAIKFKLKDGTDTDIVSHSFNGFPTETAEQFRQLINALAASKPGLPSPSPAEAFFGTHPIAKAFFDNATVMPVSFATLPYFGVNAFRFTNKAGESHFVRYQIVPTKSEMLSAEQVKNASANYLEDELPARLRNGPVEFTLQVQVAEPRDDEKNPSIAWPATRRIVKLGHLQIDRVVADSDSAEKALLFLPTSVPAGIATADPMLEARSGAYGVSFGRRHQ